MATLVIGGIASGAGASSFWMFFWTALGSYLDAAYVYPALFGSNDPTGPQLAGLRVQRGDEGAPMSTAYGEAVRVGATVIWKGPLIEERREIDVGGHGKSDSVTAYVYFVDVDVAFCDNEIESLDRLWFNGKLVYNRVPDVSVSGTTISVDRIGWDLLALPGLQPIVVQIDDASVAIGDTVVHMDGLPLDDGRPAPGECWTVEGDDQVYRRTAIENYTGGEADVTFWPPAQVAWGDDTPVTMLAQRGIAALPVLRSTDADVNLALLTPGWDATISGFGIAGNNGTRRCIGVSSDGAISEATFNLGGFESEPEAAGNLVTVSQDLPQIMPGAFAAITVYLGTETQGADPLVESYEGIGEVPSYRGHAHAVLQRVSLEDFGSVFPNVEGLVRESTGRTIGGAIGLLLEEAGLDATQYDTSAVTSTLGGILKKGPQPVGQVLQLLVVAYDLVVFDDAGVLTFVPRSSLVDRVIPPEKLGVFHGKPELDPIEAVDTADDELPKSVVINYFDPANQYLSGSQVAQLINHSSDSPHSLNLPLTLTASQALSVAMRVLWTAHANRHRLKTMLPPSEVLTHEAERLSIEALGETWRPLLSRVDVGVEWLIEIEGVHEEPDTLTFDDPSTDPPGGRDDDDDEIDYPAQPVFLPLDLAPLQVAQEPTLGFYVAIYIPSPETNWRGAILFKSDDDVAYDQILTVPNEAFAGTAKSTLPDSPAVGYWDNVSTVDIEMYDGQLDSSTDLAVLNGANRIVIGGEVVAWVNAVLVGTRTYRLSRLIRGLRGTDAWKIGHATTEPCVLLSLTGLNYLEVPLSEVRVEKFFKAVPATGLESDYVGVPYATEAATGRCLAPVHLRGSRIDTNDLTITWKRRSRGLVRLLGGTPVPLLEPSEEYEIDVFDAAGDVVRTISVLGTTSALYTAAEQTTDGLTPGDQVELEIFQLSARLGRGLGSRRAV